jgi:hypothetical protein
MTILEDDRLDAAVPELAVEALSAAYRRALQAGHTLVFVKDGVLVRRGASGITELKKIPARQKVSTRTKKAKS